MNLIRPSKRDRAATIVELSLASTILLAVLALCGMLFSTSASTFHKTDTRTDLLASLQLVGSRWTRDVMSTHKQGTAIAPDACALLTPQGTLPISTQGVYSNLVWQGYRVYYRKPDGEVWLRNVDLVTPTIQPMPLNQVDLGSGPQLLTSYCTGGTRLAQSVTSLVVSQSGNSLQLSLQASRQRAGSPQPEKLSLAFYAVIRNVGP